jgi:predicted RNase H-like HicB family nuclease
MRFPAEESRATLSSDTSGALVMLTYRAAYRMQMGAVVSEVLDFPGATAFGATLAEARANLVSALRYAAESMLRRGELLPMPNTHAGAVDAYLVEPILLVPETATRVAVRAGC